MGRGTRQKIGPSDNRRRGAPWEFGRQARNCCIFAMCGVYPKQGPADHLPQSGHMRAFLGLVVAYVHLCAFTAGRRCHALFHEASALLLSSWTAEQPPHNVWSVLGVSLPSEHLAERERPPPAVRTAGRSFAPSLAPGHELWVWRRRPWSTRQRPAGRRIARAWRPCR